MVRLTEEEAGHDSFAMGSEVCVNVDNIQVTGNVDDIAAYGLRRGLGGMGESGYVPSQANN